jgi:hypothetical protein
MSDTPETDAAIWESKGQWSFAIKECSQRLERQRDEAVAVMRETRRRLDDAWLEIERLKKAHK